MEKEGKEKSARKPNVDFLSVLLVGWGTGTGGFTYHKISFKIC